MQQNGCPGLSLTSGVRGRLLAADGQLRKFRGVVHCMFCSIWPDRYAAGFLRRSSKSFPYWSAWSCAHCCLSSDPLLIGGGEMEISILSERVPSASSDCSDLGK